MNILSKQKFEEEILKLATEHLRIYACTQCGYPTIIEVGCTRCDTKQKERDEHETNFI